MAAEPSHFGFELEDEEEERKRCDHRFQQIIKKITESGWFNGFIMFVIFLNAVFMALETSEMKVTHRTLLETMDNIFLSIYSVEMVLKIYAEPKNYWFSGYNLFDFAIVMISYVQNIVTAVQDDPEGGNYFAILRVLRAMRSLRTLRTISFVRGLQVLVTALVETIRSTVVNIVLLLLLLMFLFGIMGYYFFGYPTHGDKKYWGNLGRAMLTLFTYVTVDGWTDLQENLPASSAIYSIIFIFLGHFIFTNVFIAVIIMNIHEATEAYQQEKMDEKEAVVAQKKEYMLQRHHEEIQKLMEKQKGSRYANFTEMAAQFEKTLRHEDYIIMEEMCADLMWIETYLTSLDHQENTLYRLQQLYYEAAHVLVQYADDRLAEDPENMS
ncbi:cation channel sperm-associated protein 3-like [Branchiostoma lanceolatum]|uniref:CATSPER3 protein n=1 Tax=Branchiostoma lanceolatum TaxID=7740 RepID=A0A8J9Z2H8_BRALA|nr:CATSPER3 [Branchiostoma lanceolatum]